MQLALGVAQREAGIPDFRDTLIGAANRARDAGAVDVFIAAALGLNRGDRARTYFVDDERVALLEYAVELLRLRSDPQLARALAVLAQELIHDYDWRRRIALSDEALSIARETGDDRLLCDVLRLRFETIRLPDTLATRTRDAAELVEIAARAGDPLALAFGHVWSSRVALEMGVVRIDRPDAARRLIGDLLPIIASAALRHEEKAEVTANVALSAGGLRRL